VAQLETDLVIVGAGMAGLTAGAFAASHGLDVIVAECAPEIGGNARHAMGKVWTTPTCEALDAEDPDGDRELHEAIVATYPELIEWIRGTGVWVGDAIEVLHNGRGFPIDILGYLERCRRIIESHQGVVVPQARAERLETEDGTVTGVWLTTPDDDEPTLVRARVTLLATGGFQGDGELRRELIGPHSDQLLLRANPFSRGDGLRLGRSVGGELHGKANGYYGHLIAEPLRSFGPSEFLRLSLKFSPRCVMVNLAGERFTDESKADHWNAQAVGEQPEGRALVVFDDRVHAENVDLLAEVRAAGAHLVSADSLAGLVAAVAAWGYPARQVEETVTAYNAALGSGAAMRIPRRSLREPVALDGMLHAAEVRSGITFTHAGLRATPDGEVCRGAGVVPGLLAAGADVGGSYAGGYAGGLSMAGGFGLRAARRALRLV
jgi:succinate dehydrogenase/fumarate reductase flavoprotein subunit